MRPLPVFWALTMSAVVCNVNIAHDIHRKVASEVVAQFSSNSLWTSSLTDIETDQSLYAMLQLSSQVTVADEVSASQYFELIEDPLMNLLVRG